MINMQVKIEGLEKFKSALEEAPYLTVTEISKAIQKSLITVANQAKKEAPVNKGFGGGTLRQKITSLPIMETRLRGKIESQAPYSGYVEGGTRPHIIRVKNKKVLANKRLGKFFGEKVKHPGTKANPFFQRAVEKTKTKVDEFFSKALENITKSLT
jgi:HK97 gp10 family phage protein